MAYSILGQFGDVDKPFNTLRHSCESAEVHQFGDLPFDHFANLEALGHGAPGFGLQASQAETDALLCQIHVEDVHLDFLPHVHDIARMTDPFPREFGQMDQSICAA